MSDAAVDSKTTPEKTVASPEKEKPTKEVVEEKAADEATEEKEEAPASNGTHKNGKDADKDDKEKTESEEAPVENGVAKEGDAAVTAKRKSEASADVADGKVEGVSPEKKAKLDLDEKVENGGEAEATA